MGQVAEESSLKQFVGTYLGFAPTDESAVVCGEIEIIIDDEQIKIRHATGLKIEEKEIRVSDFEPLTREEVRAQFQEGQDASDHSLRMAGFKNKSGDHPLLLFTKDPQEGDLGLIVRMGGTVEECFGPMVLFSPAQVARGEYERAVDEMEQGFEKGILPRLRNEGKAEKNE